MEAVAAQPKMSIDAMIRNLADLREEYTERQKANAARIEEYMQTMEAELEIEKNLKLAVANLETAIKTNAAEAYIEAIKTDPNTPKKLFKGLTITRGEKVAYKYDPCDALEYAKKHDMCLKLDTEAFENLCAIPSTRPKFVVTEIVTTTGARIDSDLRKAGVE